MAATMAPVTTGGIKPLDPAMPGSMTISADHAIKHASRHDAAKRDVEIAGLAPARKALAAIRPPMNAKLDPR